MICQADCVAALVELQTRLGAMRGRRGEPARNQFLSSSQGGIHGTNFGDLLFRSDSRWADFASRPMNHPAGCPGWIRATDDHPARFIPASMGTRGA